MSDDGRLTPIEESGGGGSGGGPSVPADLVERGFFTYLRSTDCTDTIFGGLKALGTENTFKFVSSKSGTYVLPERGDGASRLGVIVWPKAETLISVGSEHQTCSTFARQVKKMRSTTEAEVVANFTPNLVEAVFVNVDGLAKASIEYAKVVLSALNLASFIAYDRGSDARVPLFLVKNRQLVLVDGLWDYVTDFQTIFETIMPWLKDEWGKNPIGRHPWAHMVRPSGTVHPSELKSMLKSLLPSLPTIDDGVVLEAWVMACNATRRTEPFTAAVSRAVTALGRLGLTVSLNQDSGKCVLSFEANAANRERAPLIDYFKEQIRDYTSSMTDKGFIVLSQPDDTTSATFANFWRKLAVNFETLAKNAAIIASHFSALDGLTAKVYPNSGVSYQVTLSQVSEVEWWPALASFLKSEGIGELIQTGEAYQIELRAAVVGKLFQLDLKTALKESLAESSKGATPLKVQHSSDPERTPRDSHASAALPPTVTLRRRNSSRKPPTSSSRLRKKGPEAPQVPLTSSQFTNLEVRERRDGSTWVVTLKLIDGLPERAQGSFQRLLDVTNPKGGAKRLNYCRDHGVIVSYIDGGWVLSGLTQKVWDKVQEKIFVKFDTHLSKISDVSDTSTYAGSVARTVRSSFRRDRSARAKLFASPGRPYGDKAATVVPGVRRARGPGSATSRGSAHSSASEARLERAQLGVLTPDDLARLKAAASGSRSARR